MWRRALAATIAMVGASAAFLAVVLLLLGTIVDRAVTPAASHDKADTEASAPAVGAKDGPKSEGATSPASQGEQS
jgi:hypothetical protein